MPRKTRRKLGRPRVVHVVTRMVLARAKTYEDALVIAERYVGGLPDWNKVEVCYWPVVDQAQAKKGPWTVEAVKHGGPNGEGKYEPKGEQPDAEEPDQLN